MSKQCCLVALAGAVLLTAPACTNSSETKNEPFVQDDKYRADSNALFDVSPWAVLASGKIPFSADAQNLLSNRHRATLAELTDGSKDSHQPQLYMVKAGDLIALQEGLDVQASARKWERVPPTLLSGRQEDHLAGSWSAAWRKPDGNVVVVSGLLANQANASGNVPMLIDEAG